MSLHLITGYAGEEHITSADQGAYNMGTYGEGEFVLDRGSKFEATIVSNNSITIADGEAMMQGRYIRLAAGTTESVSIDNGSQGMNRKDLICLHYEKNSGTGIETVSLVVKKGTESSSTPSDPSYTTGDITDGTDLINEMPLYRVNLTGLNISSLDSMFSVKVSMIEYMEDYQLPIASTSQLGGIKVGNTFKMSAGKMNLNADFTSMRSQAYFFPMILVALVPKSNVVIPTGWNIIRITTQNESTINNIKKYLLTGIIKISDPDGGLPVSYGNGKMFPAFWVTSSSVGDEFYVDVLVYNDKQSSVTIPAGNGSGGGLPCIQLGAINLEQSFS